MLICRTANRLKQLLFLLFQHKFFGSIFQQKMYRMEKEDVIIRGILLLMYGREQFILLP